MKLSRTIYLPTGLSMTLGARAAPVHPAAEVAASPAFAAPAVATAPSARPFGAMSLDAACAEAVPANDDFA